VAWGRQMIREAALQGSLALAIRALQVAAVCATVGFLGGTPGEAANSPPPRVIAVVPSAGGAGSRLMPVDARTLAPLPQGWSRAAGQYPSAALSPSGARVAISKGTDSSARVIDTTTGRIVHTYVDAPSLDSIFWLGGNALVGPSPALLIAEIFENKPFWSASIFSLFEGGDSLEFEGAAWPDTALEIGLVFAFERSLLVYGAVPGRPHQDLQITISLPRMPLRVPFGVVADVAHDRLFFISSAGLIAEIDRINERGRRPRVRYHDVDLNSRPFNAAWAGAGRIALWGADGLGTIDTRTWTTHAIAPNVTNAITTPFGIAAWTDNPADGLTVYRPQGKPRLRALVGERIKAVRTVGSFVYADTDGDARYSIDLRTGKVVRTLRPDATILVPNIVAIP
jgi:hypothetical protein